MIINYSKLFRNLNITVTPSLRSYVTALFVSGERAMENYAVLRPYFDFNKKLKDRQKLEENLKVREHTGVDLSQFYQKWEIYREIKSRQEILEKRRVVIADELRKLDGQMNEDSLRKFKSEGVIVRENLRALKSNSYKLEDKFIQEYLTLPNDLDDRTPISGENEIYTSNTPHELLEVSVQNHLNYTEFVRSMGACHFYLLEDAAKFDLQAPYYIMNLFKNIGFVSVSCPDFVKSILIEAATESLDNYFLLNDEDNKDRFNLTHLAGNGSILSYLGYIAKISIFPSILPLKFISTGKQYTVPRQRPNDDNNLGGLYEATQNTTVQCFTISDNEQKNNEIFEETLNHLIELYKIFNIPFRLVYTPANRLTSAESLRVTISMHSKFHDRYIDVGHLSCYRDFICKRLLFVIKDGKGFRFPHLMGGTVANITRILAILLENGSFKYPEYLNL